MSNSNGVTNIRDKKHFNNNLNAEAATRIEKISILCSRHLVELLQNMFDGIDDSFFELANNARTNNEQNQLFEAMREIRIKRKSIESNFENNIRNLFSTSTVFKRLEKQVSNQEIDFEHLSLINKDEVRQDLIDQGSIFRTGMDTENLIHLIARSNKECLQERIVDALKPIKGAYCFIFQSRTKQFIVRDKYGVRPLSIGKIKSGGYACYVMPAFNMDNKNNSNRRRIVKKVLSSMDEYDLIKEEEDERVLPTIRRSHNIKWASLEREKIYLFRKK